MTLHKMKVWYVLPGARGARRRISRRCAPTLPVIHHLRGRGTQCPPCSLSLAVFRCVRGVAGRWAVGHTHARVG